MQLIKSRCTGCGYCVLTCPYDALQTNGWAQLISEKCVDCNLCVHACPNNCFVPDVPLPSRVANIKDNYDVVIIGSGLGGLMAGAALAQAGRSVAVFEALNFSGGRYTELNYKNAAVTTGAWTNLGPRSHIGRFLLKLGIELEYVSLEDVGLPEQYAVHFLDGRHYGSLFNALTPAARKAWLKGVLGGRKKLDTLTHISAADYIAQFSADPDLLALVDAIAATASGVYSNQMPASEFIQITLAGREAGTQFAMPRGGVRAIIEALEKILTQENGDLFLVSPVAKILLEDDKAVGVELVDGQKVYSKVVIHNGGPKSFVALAGVDNLPDNYVNKLTDLKSAECAALFVATREPLFTDAPILMTPNGRRVTGIFSPTIFDPTMSTDGHYLFDAFFPLQAKNRTAELDLALADMRDLFPNFDDTVAWMVPMFFTGAWPGTESGQMLGQTGNDRLAPVTPLENCYMVGLDVQGSGVAGDLIPLGVQKVLASLN